MRWTETEVVDWLKGAGLVGRRSVSGVASMSHRATSVLVTLDDGDALFVKRTRADRREGALLEALWASEELGPLRELLPPLVHHDAELNVAVTRGLSGYTTMRELAGWRPPGEGPLVRRVAEGLARVHAVSAAGARHGVTAARIKSPVPCLDALSPADLARAPGTAFPRFVAVVQEVGGPLAALRDGWRPECLVHGDFKDDNVMVRSDASDPRPVFVDWELAGWGDPLWDVGSILGQFLYHWVTSIRPEAGSDFAAWVRNASVPFAEVRRSAAAFVAAYASASGTSRDPRATWVTTAVRYAGVFLLHRALGTIELVGALAQPAASCLHVGKTLVGDAERARAIVIGEPS